MAVSFIGGGNRSVPENNYRPATSQLYSVHHEWAGFEFTMLVMIGTECTGSCKSNYHRSPARQPLIFLENRYEII